MVRSCLLFVLFALLLQPLRAQDALVEKVRRGIERGVKNIQEQQRNDGGFEVGLAIGDNYGGTTSLAVLALLNAGVPANHERVMKPALNFVRRLSPKKTYVKALQTMVLAEAAQPEDLALIQQNVDWLIDGAQINQGKLLGWSYNNLRSGGADNSNSQYALLGIFAGRQAGARVPRAFWEKVRESYERTQNEDGGWSYSARGLFGGGISTLTMTEAGVSALLMATMELDLQREMLQPDGRANNCGLYPDNVALEKGIKYIGDQFKFEIPGRTYYNVYGIERVGRFSGLRFLGRHDWYRAGCEFLVGAQRDDGSWSGDYSPMVSTGFAVLFLSKGRTPILISKIVHSDAWPRHPLDNDWNNDRNDLRHLVAFAAKELFQTPLSWQNFDIMRAITPRADVLTDQDLADVTSDMLQAPILYITGHKSPQFRFRPIEKEMLKRYIDNGGFILAEACCNSPDFDRGFKALCADLWPDDPLIDMEGTHPVWGMHYPVKPGDPYPLLGINRSCKTVLMYSPQDLSCQWEGNHRTTSPRGDRAFKLGTNIIAYATGLEPPKPRLTKTEVVAARDDGAAVIPRGFLKVAQLKHGGDWQPAPRAMRNLMDHLRRYAGIDVSLKTEEVLPFSEKVIDYKFLYMHGRADFQFTKDQLKHLQFNLNNGGLLFSDACCGREAFDKAFRRFVKDLFPDKILEIVPANDPLYSRELNGIALNETAIKGQRQAGKGFQPMPPFLEGIKINDRWAVLYSKYDIGCALEKHKAADCLGYDSESANRIAGAAVLYTLRP